MNRRPIIAVCGAGSCDETVFALARETGLNLAREGAVLLCGGLGGVMAAAAEGAKEAQGLTIGLLPGTSPEDANMYIDLALPTGLGHLRNALIVRAAGAIIALPGGHGTMSEVALGLKMQKPVIGLAAWSEVPGVIPASTPVEAVRLALEAARGRPFQ